VFFLNYLFDIFTVFFFFSNQCGLILSLINWASRPLIPTAPHVVMTDRSAEIMIILLQGESNYPPKIKLWMESLEITKEVVYFNGESAIRLPVSSVADQLNLAGLGIVQRPSEFIARLDRRAWPSFDEKHDKMSF